MKTSPDQQFSLYDRLAHLHNQFRRAGRNCDSLVLDAGDIAQLLVQLSDAAHEAERLYSKLSARFWNERAAADPLAEAVLAQIGRCDTNIVLFPVVCRPIPGDAPQNGGAA